MGTEYAFVRAVLAWVCAGHAVMGFLALVSGKRAIRLGSRLYGASFEPADQFEYALRPLGAFMLALAFLQGMAAWQPWRFKAVIDATLVVLVLRQVQRVLFARQATRAFGIPLRRHWLNVVFFLVQAALLLLARARARWTPA